MIIGITGTYCSGKDTAAAYLISLAYQHTSLSDLIREEATRRCIAHTRKHLIDIGNELRKTYGAGILAERALERIQTGNNNVITSIRNPGEVTVLRTQPDFKLIALDAPLELRWKWMCERGARPDNIETIEQFIDFEREEHNIDPTKQQLHLVQQLADVTIQNNGTLYELHTQLDTAIGRRN